METKQKKSIVIFETINKLLISIFLSFRVTYVSNSQRHTLITSIPKKECYFLLCKTIALQIWTSSLISKIRFDFNSFATFDDFITFDYDICSSLQFWRLLQAPHS